MGLLDEMKKLKEEILASYKTRAEEYQQRLKENEELVSEVQKTLDQFHTSHLEMAASLRADAENLRKNLGEEETNRLNAFGNLMSGIHGSISSIQKEVEDIRQSTGILLDNSATSRDTMSKELHGEFAKERDDRQKQEADRMKEFDLLQKNIWQNIDQSKEEVRMIIENTDELLKKYSNDHTQMANDLRNNLNENLEERIRNTRALLKNFHERMTEVSKGNQIMAETLRKELSAGDKKRIEEYDRSMGIIRSKIKEIQDKIAGLLNDLADDRFQSAKEWQSMEEAIAKLRSSVDVTVPVHNDVIVSPKKQEEKKQEKNTEEEDDDQVLEEKGKELDPIKEKSLEEKILDFLNAHPKGVKVSEMEEPLGEQRMRIGYVCKKLLEEGKITKLDHAYFPLGKPGKINRDIY